MYPPASRAALCQRLSEAEEGHKLPCLSQEKFGDRIPLQSPCGVQLRRDFV